MDPLCVDEHTSTPRHHPSGKQPIGERAMSQDTPSQEIAKKMIARFPIIHAPVPDANVGGGSYDVGVKDFKISLNKAAASDDQIGRYDAIIHLHNGEDWTGFQGGAYYKFLDEQGNVVFAMMGDVYGVNGKLIPGSPSTVDKIENKFIPLDILSGIFSVDIVPVRMEDSMVNNIKKTVDDFAKGAEVVKDGIQKIGATVSEIAAAIKSL